MNTLITEAGRLSETSISVYMTTRRNNLEGSHIQSCLIGDKLYNFKESDCGSALEVQNSSKHYTENQLYLQ